MQLSRQIVPEAKSTPATKPAPQAALTPAQVQRLSEIKQRAGWIPPDYQLDLAKSGATNEAVDAVANMKAKQIVDDQASEEPDGGWLRRNLYDRLKAGSRWLTAGLNFVPEFVQGGLAQLTDDNTNVDGWFIGTSLGSMIENPELQGEGFFAGEKLMEKQAERARRYRGTVNGSAWTVGRGAANIVFKPNSKPYNIMSGILDAVVMVKVDPTGPITKAAKYVTKGGNTVPLFADEATRVLREALESEAGITRGLAGATLDGTKFDRFTRTNGRMVRLIDRLTQEKDALRISEDIFDHNIPNEMAVALADATDPNVVRAILATGWTVRGGTTLPQDIRLIQGNRISSAVGDFLAERAPFVDGIKKSRYFTKMGDARVITHGTQDDNRKAVQSIVSYLRTAGVDQEEIKKIGDLALRSFTPVASDVARKRTMDAFYSSMKAVMKLDGIPDESIDELFNVGRRKTDQIRRYLQDRLGRPFDNGYRSYLMNKDRGFVPEEQIETIIKELGLDLGEKAAITSPTELVELLDRMIVLPDLREVRRFTRNPLFREVMTKTVVTDQKLFDDLTRQLNELLAKTEPTDYDKSTIDYIRKQLESLQVKAPRGDKFAKVPVTAKRQKRMVTVIKDQKRFDELTEEMNTIFAKAAADEADMARVEEIQKELSTLKVKEERKVITPDQRAGLAAVDFIQNELWKPLALATGGYVVRNSLDAQVRMAFSELPSLFTHPFEYINLVLGTSKKMTLRLEDISKVRAAAKAGEVLPEGTVTLDDVVADVREALTFNLRQQGLGANEIENHMVATGSFDNVQRDMANGLELHTDAVVQNGRRTQADTLRKVATQTFVEMGGVSKPAIDQAANRIVNIILSDDAIRKQIDDLHEYGFEITSQSGKSVRTPPIILRDLDEAERKAAYRQYAYRISVGNAQILTGSVPEAEFMYAFGYVPKTKAGKMDGAFESPLKDLDILEGEGKVGSIVQVAPNEIGIITKLTDLSGQVVIDPFDGTTVELLGDVATVQPVFPDQAFTQTYGSREARKLIQQLPVSDDPAKAGLPAVLKRELMMNDERNKDKIQTIRDTYDKGVDWFFGQAYASVTRKLERSPVFREYYYRQVTELADRLKPEDAQRFLDDALKKAKEAGMSVEKYVGDKKLISVLKQSSKSAGDVSLEELDDYAKHVALNQTKELLYDASNRTNLEDVLRVIMPFAPAWKEIMGTYAGFLKSNPLNAGRSFQRIYTGLQGADPDNDGRGFFYEDPTTGQMMFTFPGTGTVAKVLTGLDAPLEAPVKRLSQGIQSFPALGPMAQVGFSKIAPHIPQSEFFTSLLLPYGLKGPQTAFNPTPQWLQKLTQVFTAPTEQLDTQYANLYIDTMRALSASGDYDLSSKSDLRQLEEDAKFKARILMAFRALSQFTGPTAGTTEFKIETDQGDIFVSQLIKEFYDMQADPDIGYDKAVPRFLELYGDEAALYVASKTKSVAEGLEATKEFQDWRDANKDLVKDYPDVANYLAPAGSDFNFSVWTLQLQRGERVRLSSREIIELAQRRIGSAKYRQARLQVGPYPSEEAKALLSQYREVLHKQYPGFPANAEFEVGAFYNDVRDLKDMVLDSRVAGDETAGAIKEYLLARDKAIALSGVSEEGFKTAKSAARYRAGLESVGLALSQKYPNFSRIYDRLLASEVE